MTTAEETQTRQRWFHPLADFFRLKLSAPTAERWAIMFKEDIEGVTEGEIIDALFWARDNWKRKTKYQPDYPEVKDMIEAYRRQKKYRHAGITTPGHVEIHRSHNKQGEYDPSTTVTDMGTLKGLLNKNPPPDEAWSIICLPLMAEQCRELRDYCDTHGIEYRRFKPDYSKVKQAMAKIGRAE